jgi:hypothetical protein
MKPYEIIARRAEEYAKEARKPQEKLGYTATKDVTLKDGSLNDILACVSWLDRLPGSREKKAPYTKRIWDCYLAVQQGRLDDTTMIPQILGGNRVTYSEDQAVETSISDSGIGTGGLGYASVRSADMGTAFRKKPSDKYFHKYPKSKCRTLEGDEKIQAYKEYKKNVSSV